VPAEPRSEGAFAVLPSGPLPTNPLRTLSSPAFVALVEQARSAADVVLVDTPPIGTVNDSAPVSLVVDTVTFVVRLEQSTKDASKRALRVLAGLDVRMAGVVLTGARANQAYGYYPNQPPAAGVAAEGERH
jgi:Mrp family chromosome partitioning ATPase